MALRARLLGSFARTVEAEARKKRIQKQLKEGEKCRVIERTVFGRKRFVVVRGP